MNIEQLQQLPTSELCRYVRKQILSLNQTEMAGRLGYGSQKDVSRIETGVYDSNQVRAHLLDIARWETNTH